MTPPVVVFLPSALAGLFPDSDRRVELHVSTIDDMMDALDRRWPGMRDRLCDSRPAIRRHINIFVEGERATLATVLEPGTEVYVLTAISGG
jgi:hypothetical protein